MEDFIKAIATVEISDEKRKEALAEIVSETTLEVLFNGQSIAKIACCGSNIDELAIGFLFAEGIIASNNEIENILVLSSPNIVKVCGKDVNGIEKYQNDHITSSGAKISSTLYNKTNKQGQTGNEKVNSTLTISEQQIALLFDELVNNAQIHQRTRGTHSGAIADQNGIIVLREDIGRHNVADMLAGYSILNEMDMSDKYVVRTGRVSAEIVTKYYKMGINIILSLSVPTLSAIEFAKKMGISLVSAGRSGRVFIYTGSERIVK
ncbi:MAG: formate dehydrogenase accessory sulfurtransferase FdhD [Deltaproteobacteria bacterium]